MLIENTKKLREKLKLKKKIGPLTIQCDELWSFVGNKWNKVWLWLALDIETAEIMGAFCGDRDKSGAYGLWQSFPPEYRQCAVIYTDFWDAYTEILPTKRHKAVDKTSGKTNRIERLNGTLRQRISRLVRKTLLFSKKFVNHLGAIWNFIHYYNSALTM